MYVQNIISQKKIQTNAIGFFNTLVYIEAHKTNVFNCLIYVKAGANSLKFISVKTYKISM